MTNNKNNKLIEVIEIWIEDKNGKVYNFDKKKRYKQIALLADGKPIRLNEKVLLERGYFRKEFIEKLT